MKQIRVSFIAASLFYSVVPGTLAAQNPQPTQGTQPPQQQNSTEQLPQTETKSTAPSQPSEADRRFSFNSGAAAAAMPTARRSPDAELAGCLTIDNEAEVHAGRFALERTERRGQEIRCRDGLRSRTNDSEIAAIHRHGPDDSFKHRDRGSGPRRTERD